MIGVWIYVLVAVWLVCVFCLVGCLVCCRVGCLVGCRVGDNIFGFKFWTLLIVSIMNGLYTHVQYDHV